VDIGYLGVPHASKHVVIVFGGRRYGSNKSYASALSTVDMTSADIKHVRRNLKEGPKLIIISSQIL
jgi:hypothetical protein